MFLRFVHWTMTKSWRRQKLGRRSCARRYLCKTSCFFLHRWFFPYKETILLEFDGFLRKYNCHWIGPNRNFSTHMTFQWEFIPILMFPKRIYSQLRLEKNTDNFEIHKFDLIKIFAFSTLEWIHLAVPILCVLNMKRIDCHCL